MRINKPWWTAIVSIRGFEDPPAGTGGEDTGGDDTGQQGPGIGDEGTDPGEGSDEDTDEGSSGLKSALEKERANRKAAEKKIKAFEKAQQAKDDAEKTEIQRLTDSSTKSSEKISKLAAAFRTSKVHDAIVKAAAEAKFTDPSDAIRPEVLAQIGVEQDEDDPSDVTIDAASVKKAIEDLAKAKPHYLVQEDQQNRGRRQPPPSGSKFGGSNVQKPSAEDRLKEMYPALSRRG